MSSIIWQPDPILMTLGPLTIRWYGLLFLAGFYAAYKGMIWFAKQEKKPFQQIDNLLVFIFWGTFIGARLVHCFFYEPQIYFANPVQVLFVWQGGLASHGALAGIVAAIYLFSRKFKSYPFLWVLDRVAIMSALSGFFIRVGNFFNSEIIGKPFDGFLSVVFKNIDSTPRYPAQLFESLWYLLSFVCLMLIYRKLKTKVADGFFFGLAMIFIFLSRFFIEFVKENQSSFESLMPINMGQALSLPVIVIGIIMMIKFKNAKIQTSRK
jgi:phosphatidylglycerol:prolipoprotein diacylglycerol transferase